MGLVREKEMTRQINRVNLIGSIGLALVACSDTEPELAETFASSTPPRRVVYLAVAEPGESCPEVGFGWHRNTMGPPFERFCEYTFVATPPYLTPEPDVFNH